MSKPRKMIVDFLSIFIPGLEFRTRSAILSNLVVSQENSKNTLTRMEA